MEFKEFKAGPDDNDRRLDRVIRKLLPSENLSGLYKTIRKGLIKVNDKKTSPETHIAEGDSIKIAAFLLEPSKGNGDRCKDQTSAGFPFEIIFRDENLFFINKPYDFTVQGDSESLDKTVRHYYEKSLKETASLSFKPGPLHRLDRRTTGLLAFSWSLKGARWFSENIQNHIIKKTYLGIVQGHLPEHQHWEDFIKHNETEENSGAFFTVKASSCQTEDSKKSLTDAFPLAYGLYKETPVTLVKFEIGTGRTHQIRSQSSLHGFPLLGDTSYGGMELKQKTRLFLHAWKLEFPEGNPLNLPLCIKASLPESFMDFLKASNCEINPLSL